MAYKPKTGESEFGGVPGPYPDQNLAAPSLEQETWALYATNEGGGKDKAGEDTATVEWGRKHIGKAKRSASPGAGH